MSITTARERFRPEMTSSVDGATQSHNLWLWSDREFLFVFRRRLSSTFNRFDVTSAFTVVDNGGMPISTAGAL